jgi:hypothetical protein
LRTLPSPTGRLRLATAVAGLLGLAACGPDDTTHEITDVRERKDAGPPARRSSTAERLGGAHDAGEDEARLVWTTPEGWEEAPAGRMVEAAWRVGGSPDVEVSFSRAGGGTGANVQRWREQMGLPPLDDAALAALPRDRALAGLPATFVDLRGRFRGRGDKDIPEARLLGLIAEAPGGGGAFLKMTGPASVVDPEEPRFHALAASFRMAVAPRDASAAPSTTSGAPPPDATEPPAPLTWTAPPEWEPAPSRPPRLVTLRPKGAVGDTVCYVTVLPGRAGGTRENLDLWRSTLGLSPLTDEEFAALPRAQVLGATAVFLTIEGTHQGQGPPAAPYMLLGMVVERAGDSVFVKMTGPSDEVRREQQRFRAFCESLRG